MKRDMDLVRDLMLWIEEQEDWATIHVGNQAKSPIEGKSFSEIYFHMDLLEQAGFIISIEKQTNAYMFFRGLTWSGSEYIESIRDPEIWRKTKLGASQVGSQTVDFMFTAAKAYAKLKAKDLLGLDL